MTSVWPYVILGTLTAFIAYLGLLNTRDISRMRAASDLLHSILKDTRLEDASLTVSLVYKSNSIQLVDFANAENEKTNSWLGSDKTNPFRDKSTVRYVDVVDDILHVLCYYDFIACGIKHRVYDEQVIKDSLYSRVVGFWDVLEPFVKVRRGDSNGQQTMWQDLEVLADRWKEQGRPIKPKNNEFNNISSIEKMVKNIGNILK